MMRIGTKFANDLMWVSPCLNRTGVGGDDPTIIEPVPASGLA